MWSIMPNEHFDKSVAVSDQAGRSRIVSDTMQAAEVLLRRWPPDRRGVHYVAAVKACLDSLEGRAAAIAARRAFARAARSAGILAGSRRDPVT
jgi:hypothetical protein